MFKKSYVFLLASFLLIFSFLVNTNAIGIEEELTAFGSSYYVYSQPDSKDLGYGVQYYRDLGYTKINQSGLCTSQIAGSDGGGNLVLGQYYHQQVNVLELKTTETLKVVPYANLNTYNWVLTSVRKSAALYENENPGWRVIAAINGDFFNTSSPYGSTGVTVSNGEYYKSYTNEKTLVFKNDGVGTQVVATNATASSPFLSIYDANGNIVKKVAIDALNKQPGANETNAYFLQRTGNNSATFTTQKAEKLWMVRNADKAVTTIVNYFYGIGNITEYVSNSFDMVRGEFGIASNNQEVNDLLKVATKIRLQWEFTNSALKDAQNCVSVPHTILDNNAYSQVDTTRHPRTMIGLRADGTIIMIVVDGRQVVVTFPDEPSRPNEYNEFGYHGVCGSEMGVIMKYYGCVDAWNLDGGGSSTMLVRKQDNWTISSAYKDTPDSGWYVTNSPSDKSERSDGNCLLIVAKIPTYNTVAVVTSSTITLNIATLEALEEYKNLYIELNGIKKKVQDGAVSFDGLTSNTTYVYKYYAQVDGEYVNLYTQGSAITYKVIPSITKIQASVIYVNEEAKLLIRVTLANTEAYNSIVLVVNGEEYKAKSMTFTIDLTNNILVNDDYKLILTYDINDKEGAKTIEFPDFDYNIASSLLVIDAITIEYQNLVNNIWK